jgi:hypothetical protein
MNAEILKQVALCKQVTTDLDCLLEEVIEGSPTPDQVANMLLGIIQLTNVRFSKLDRLLNTNSL